MKQRFILFRRAGVYYAEDTVTRKQISLRTKDEGEALALLNAKNESFRQPVLNLQIARAYLTATDPAIAQRQVKNRNTTERSTLVFFMPRIVAGIDATCQGDRLGFHVRPQSNSGVLEAQGKLTRKNCSGMVRVIGTVNC